MEIPDDVEAARLHTTLLRYFYEDHVSALAASTACSLLRRDFSRLLVLVSWWVALKFEEVYQPDIKYLLTLFHFKEGYTDACEAERTLLCSVGFVVPFKTPIRDMYNTATRLTRAELRDWSFVLLYSNMTTLKTGCEWIRVIEEERTSCILCFILALAPANMKRNLRPPRKRKSVSE